MLVCFPSSFCFASVTLDSMVDFIKYASDIANSFFFPMQGLGALQYSCYIYKLYLCRSTLYEDESDAGTLEWDELLSKCVQKYEFEFGLFSDYFTTKIGTRSFIQRYTYSLAWGLKSLRYAIFYFEITIHMLQKLEKDLHHICRVVEC